MHARRATASSSRSWAATTRKPTRPRSSSTRRESDTGSPRARSRAIPFSGCSRPRSSVAEIVEYLARRLVDAPDAVRVEQVDREGATVLQLWVAPDDVGKVIGRQGRIARALRTVVRASAARDERRVMLEIME